MAIKCKNIFSGATLDEMNADDFQIARVFDQNIRKFYEEFDAVIKTNKTGLVTKSQVENYIEDVLKTTPANDIPAWRATMQEKGYAEDMTAFAYVLRESSAVVKKYKDLQFNKKFPSIVKAVEVVGDIENTLKWFLSDDFIKAQEAYTTGIDKIPGFKNAIKEAKIYRDTGGKKGNQEDLMFHVMMGLLANNNFQKGLGLEDLKSANMAKYFWNNVDAKMNAIDPKWSKKLKDKETMLRVYEEKQNFVRQKNYNPQKQDYASTLVKTMHDAFQWVQAENLEVGGNLTNMHFADRVQFNPLQLQKYSKEEFIELMRDKLDPANIKQNKPDFDLDNATQLDIDKELDQIAGKFWDATTNYKDVDFSGGMGQSHYLLFRNAEAEYTVRNTFTSEEPIQAIFHQFQRLSEENALNRMTGVDTEAYLREVERLLTNNQELKFASGNPFKIFAAHLRATREPSQINRAALARAFTFMRNINVLHLGFIPVEQITTEPFFAYARLSKQNKKWFGKSHKALRGLAPWKRDKAGRAAAQRAGYAIESMIGATQMRLYNTQASTFTEGGLQRASERWANNFMRWTGSTWLSDGQAAAGYDVLVRNVTEALESGTKWAELEKGTFTEDWIKELKRHGFTEQDYNQTIQAYKKGAFVKDVHGNKVFDMFQLAGGSVNTREVGKTVLRRASLFDKWHKFFGSNVDGLSRIRPGDTEKMRLGFYTTDASAVGIVGSLLKTITQFKSFSFAVGRRMHGRELQDGGNIAVLKSVGVVAAYTMLGAVVYQQLTQIASGRQPFAFDDAELYKRAFTRTPVLGSIAVYPFSEMMIQNLGNVFDKDFFTSKEFRDDAFRNMLGPALDYWVDLTADILGAPATIAKDGFTNAQGYKTLTMKMIKDIAAIAFPTGFPLSYFKYEMLDTLEEMLDPEAYYRKQKRRDNYAIDERIGGQFELSWEKILK